MKNWPLFIIVVAMLFVGGVPLSNADIASPCWSDCSGKYQECYDNKQPPGTYYQSMIGPDGKVVIYECDKTGMTCKNTDLTPDDIKFKECEDILKTCKSVCDCEDNCRTNGGRKCTSIRQECEKGTTEWSPECYQKFDNCLTDYYEGGEYDRCKAACKEKFPITVPPPPSCEKVCEASYKSCFEVMPPRPKTEQYSSGIMYGGVANAVADGTLWIHFEDIEDSRCPPNVACIQAGDASIKLKLEVSDEFYCPPDTTCFEGSPPKAKVSPNPKAEIVSETIELMLGRPETRTLKGKLYTFTLAELQADYHQAKTKKEGYKAGITIEREPSVAVMEDWRKKVEAQKIRCKKEYSGCLPSCNNKPPQACTEEARICPDGTSIGRDPYNNCEFRKCPGETKDCDAGCYSPVRGKCFSFGTRLSQQDVTLLEVLIGPMYCDIDGEFKPQKQDNEKAQNSYECLSNFQSDGKCVSVSENLNILQRILKWFSKIFGGN